MNIFRSKTPETITGNGLQPKVLASYHRVFIILFGRRKAIIDPQTASIFRQNPTFSSKTLKLIYSEAFQTILLLFTCISAQYPIVSKILGNNKIIHAGRIFKAITFHLLETLTPTKMVGIQD